MKNDIDLRFFVHQNGMYYYAASEASKRGDIWKMRTANGSCMA